MAKLVILRGLPASGKSTHAARLVMQGYKRINADDLRMSIDNNLWSKDNEKLINELMERMVRLFLNAGYNVVLDNTNLNPYKVRAAIDIANEQAADIEILDIETPVEVCLQRDLERTRGRVGKEVIMRMYNKWFKNGQFPARP